MKRPHVILIVLTLILSLSVWSEYWERAKPRELSEISRFFRILVSGKDADLSPPPPPTMGESVRSVLFNVASGSFIALVAYITFVRIGYHHDGNPAAFVWAIRIAKEQRQPIDPFDAFAFVVLSTFFSEEVDEEIKKSLKQNRKLAKGQRKLDQIKHATPKSKADSAEERHNVRAKMLKLDADEAAELKSIDKLLAEGKVTKQRAEARREETREFYQIERDSLGE